MTAPVTSSTGPEAACAGACLVCASGSLRDCPDDSQWHRTWLLVPLRSSACHTHLDLNQGHLIGTIPINSATLTWQPNTPPKNWKALVDHAERFHIVGVWTAVIAFVFFLTAVALNLAAH